MRTAAVITQWLVRLTGLTQIILGLLFWTNNALTLIPVHMMIGLLFVLSLWALATIAAIMGADRRMVALALIWGVVVVGLGMTQTQILPGAFHWVIEVVHLLVGLAALGIAQRLVVRTNLNRVSTV
jgi:hypothetical protein